MTKRILLVAVAAVLAAFVPLSVTTSAAEINCRIPFSFIVNGKTLAPGNYSLSTHDSLVTVRGAAATIFALTNGTSGPVAPPKLVFLKTGDRYDLAEIWMGDGSGREVLMSHKYRKSLENRARAANMKVERIEVAAQ